ncbi:MAG: recombinase RecT [Acidovorax sp.]|uniref:RecT family recombinase n=1 Tax=Acidovorax sp. TaxID=1872122 RepID=UPI0026349EBC|nr:RecT family recombinase [Acidovorax sp.]MDH4417703.1 recombinase RecT [Acidovorax sp.]
MNAVTTTESNALAVNSASSFSLLMDPASLDRLERIADLMASGKTTIPQHLRGSKGDCFAVVLQSMQWGMNPIAVAQKTHLVNGTLGYEGQLVAAVINTSKVVKDRFNFEWYGPWEKVIGKFTIKRSEKGEYRAPAWTMADEEGCGIRVWATVKGEATPRSLDLLLAQARVRNSTQWADDPKQQLAYLAQKKWARLYAPDVILGVYTADELAEPGEKFMGAVDEVKPEPTPYPADQFEANLPVWKKVIEGGRKTPDDLIQFAQSRNPNMPFTEDQKATLRDIKPVKNAAATDVQPKGEAAAPAADSGPALTFAHVSDKLHAAKDVDALHLAADLVSQVPDTQQQAELNALYEQRLGEFASG